jgi:hypothetical protein
MIQTKMVQIKKQVITATSMTTAEERTVRLKSFSRIRPHSIEMMFAS